MKWGVPVLYLDSFLQERFTLTFNCTTTIFDTLQPNRVPLVDVYHLSLSSISFSLCTISIVPTPTCLPRETYSNKGSFHPLLGQL